MEDDREYVWLLMYQAVITGREKSRNTLRGLAIHTGAQRGLEDLFPEVTINSIRNSEITKGREKMVRTELWRRCTCKE